jgi:hypothetical protein
VHNADPDRGPAATRQAVSLSDRAGAKLVQVEVGVTELEQTWSKLVLVGVAILLDEAVGLERLKEAMNRRPRQAEPIGELAHA